MLAHLSGAWALGCRSFDTALLYRNHETVFSTLRRYPRHSYEVTFKIPTAFQDRARVEDGVRSIIATNKLEYIDTLLVHSPKHVLHTEALDAFQRLSAAGYIRKYGLSNYTLGHLKALGAFGYQPQVVQNEINPFLQDVPFVNYCKAQRIEVQAHSIFATGKVFTDDALLATAGPQSLTLALFGWLKKIAANPIVSTTQPTRLSNLWETWHLASEADALNNIESFERNTRQCRSPEWDEFDLLPQDAYQHVLRQLQKTGRCQP